MKSLGRILALFFMLTMFAASQAQAETFVVGYQPL